MLRSTLSLFVASGLFLGSISASAQGVEAPSARCLQDLDDASRWHDHPLSCGFVRTSLSYAGSPVEQARCLLRRVPPGGDPVDGITPLPTSLERLVGTPVAIDRRQIEAYLRANGIAAEDLGGSLSSPLSRTSESLPALYFVIHDTSSPEYDSRPFGPEIDQPGSSVNDLSAWREGESSKAHLFVSRLGTSTTAVDYQIAWRATRTERCVVGVRSRGRFLHNELVQPRRTSGTRYDNDQPPAAAITKAQLDRLALLYVAASVRGGRWLIPAFHATIDEGLPGGHDDPQGFDLAQWARSLERTIAAINAIPRR
jgi:hypothetical protein